MITRYRGVLARNPAYARLWTAQAISLAGDWFNFIAIVAVIARLSNDSGLAISLALLARELPRVLFSPFAGVLLDRFDRRRFLIWSDFARVPVVLCFLLVDQFASLPLAYLLILIQFSLSAIFEPGRSALVPSTVREEDLIDANILGSVTWSVMLAVGGALGGFVSAVAGTNFAFVFDAVTFFVSGLLILAVHPNPAAAKVASVVNSGRVGLGDFVDGLRYARSHPPVLASLFIKVGGGIGNIDTFVILYATTLFVVGQGGSGTLGILWSVFGVGAVVGPLLASRRSDGSVRSMRRWVIASYGAITLGWLLFGGAGSLLIACVAIFIKAMGSSTYWTYSAVIIQKTVEDAYLGRMFALDFGLFELMQTFSIVITGVVLDSLGGELRAVVFATGLISLIPFILWSLIVPRLERWEQQPVPFAAITPGQALP